jgi:hypothetical protein
MARKVGTFLEDSSSRLLSEVPADNATEARLTAEIGQSLKQKDVIATLSNQDALTGNSSQPRFAQFVQALHSRWTHSRWMKLV